MFFRNLACVMFCLFCAVSTGQSALAQQAPTAADILDAWASSPHADASAESFTHWNKEGEIPPACATCHSGTGFTDFVGGDGSAAGAVDHPALTGSVVDCVACHNRAAATLANVAFPSGVVIDALGASAVCTVCHQGRNSTDGVDNALKGLDDDSPSADLSFMNSHYANAAATLMGGETRGGYQYAGKTYAGRFAHVAKLDSCTGCHNPHSLKVAEETCTSCHKDASLRTIRTAPIDRDGNGTKTEGAAEEIDALRALLGRAIADYAASVTGTPLAYTATTYPYFFNDTNVDGSADASEAVFPNRYQSWTPRLLRAAYNYQFVAKDPGAYTHNPHYAAQLLIDSVEDLSTQVSVNMTGVTRP